MFSKLQKPSTTGVRSNRNVSVSALTRQEKQLVNDLVVKVKQSALSASHGNSKAFCWQHVGSLHVASTDQLVDDTRLYCSPCLESIHQSGQLQYHISSVTSFGLSTSTGNINQHLSLKHGIVVAKEKSMETIEKYLQKYGSTSSAENCANIATSAHELNRDILIWFCRDLIPFEEVENEGFRAFFQKNFPNCPVPTAATLSITSLNDVYHSCMQQIKQFVQDVPGICIMFDGWTDRHRARPYVGMRISFIKDWKFHVVTLSCNVLVGHTGQQLADYVSHIINCFFTDPKKMMRSTCHDGAANMIKASRVMKADYYQHCVAHALHLLLTVDSLNDVGDVQELLSKCRNIVSTLHFKSYLIDDEITAKKDRTELDKLRTRISATSEVVELDDTYPIVDHGNVADAGDHVANEHGLHQHQHATLKMSCPTRWNSVLVMIDSILDLQSEVQNALKQVGHAELCLHASEIDMLKQLAQFLKEFESLTELVSTSGPNLSLISLMELKIRKMCKRNPTDEDWLTAVKSKISANVGRRLTSNDAAKVQRILDPGTKGLVSKDVSAAILRDAVKKCSDRGILPQADHTGSKLLTLLPYYFQAYT